MASVSLNKSTGDRTLQFTLAGRKSIWLGKMAKRDVATWKHHVEELIAARMQGNRSPFPETSAWMASLDPSLHRKLVGVGLAESRNPTPQAERPTLVAFVDRYIASHAAVKEATRKVYGHVRRNLTDFFGPDKQLADITPGDADDFRMWLVRPKSEGGQELSENTARRRCGFAKQFFRAAVRRRLIPENPFADMKGLSVLSNHERQRFISREEAAQVLDACPDAQSRLLFALARYGGLRCPSEILALRWGDVDWERSRIVVRSPKTEHHEGKESRVIPIFPELRPYLEQAWDEAEPGTEFVITCYRHQRANMTSKLVATIRRAGLEPWPKPFQNLRSTRETELADKLPMHLVCQWMGNSQSVAAKHYLQVTDEHFADATSTPTGPMHNPMQSVADTSGQEPTGKPLVFESLEKLDTCSVLGSRIGTPPVAGTFSLKPPEKQGILWPGGRSALWASPLRRISRSLHRLPRRFAQQLSSRRSF